MAKRNLIGVLTANPEGIYQQRIMEGLLAQCRLYDYDVAAFSPLVQVCHYFTPYLKGELNIFELINFDLIDGLIIPPILLSENEEYKKLDKIMEFIGKKQQSLSFSSTIHTAIIPSLQRMTEELLLRSRHISSMSINVTPKRCIFSQE